MNPELGLKNALDAPSLMSPVMVTDAKALFDLYHREGVSSSVVDKRVSPEIKVMKDRLSAMGGTLRWMPSERQFADGLTKEAARLLLAQRLRHGRLNMVWDPTYKAAKKKTKEELVQSRLESVQHEQAAPSPSMTEYVPTEPQDDGHEHLRNEIEKDEDVTWYEQVAPNVLLVRTDNQLNLNYVLRRPSHVARSPQIEPYKCRSTNFFVWMFLVLLMPQLAMGNEGEEEGKEADLFGTLLMTITLILLSTAFILGRRSMSWFVAAPPLRIDAEVQKHEPWFIQDYGKSWQNTKRRSCFGATVRLNTTPVPQRAAVPLTWPWQRVKVRLASTMKPLTSCANACAKWMNTRTNAPSTSRL